METSTLFLSPETARVALDNGHLLAERRDGAEPVRVRLADLNRIVVVGRPPVSVPVLLSLLDMGVPSFFVSSRGRWRGSLSPDDNRNAARRIRQYKRAADPVFNLAVARALVAAKLRNECAVLRRLGSNRPLLRLRVFRPARKEIERAAATLGEVRDLDALRGTEGAAAVRHFEALGSAFPATMPFAGRNRRRPKDSANALLSFAYALLLGEVECTVRAHGLDPGIGHLHRDRTRAASLALDLMEPFRPAMDRFAVKLASLGMLDATKHFERRDDGGTYFNAAGRAILLPAWEEEMRHGFARPCDGANTTLRKEIDADVCSYLRFLEDNDPPSFFALP